jgi:hypothetical protein
MLTNFLGRPERKRPLLGPEYTWENNIKVNVSEIRYEGVDWICLAEDRD